MIKSPPKTASTNAIILGVGFPTYEFGGTQTFCQNGDTDSTLKSPSDRVGPTSIKRRRPKIKS